MDLLRVSKELAAQEGVDFGERVNSLRLRVCIVVQTILPSQLRTWLQVYEGGTPKRTPFGMRYMMIKQEHAGVLWKVIRQLFSNRKKESGHSLDD